VEHQHRGQVVVVAAMVELHLVVEVPEI